MQASALGLCEPDRALIDVDSAAVALGKDNVSAFRMQVRCGAHVKGYSEQNLVMLNRHNAVPVDCRVGRETLDHVAHRGNITVIPEGVEFTGRFSAPTELIVVSIPKQRLAMSAASSGLSVRSFGPRLSGFDATIGTAVEEFSSWLNTGAREGDSELVADDLVELVASRYCGSINTSPLRGQLSNDVIADINRYVRENVGSNFSINDLADLAKQNRYNFPRLFRRTVGISPHQYVVRTRLRHARALILAGCSIAEAAIAAGFVDQSHMSSWMRRAYGLTPGMLSKLAKISTM
ncbi:AraC family transcriptional regulator (plasmid) [Agrobacterium sp. 33MFTa1.1]|uniref:helix-turn-helix transcriptional regulator n=1 Tax=Agrobacterium sp. 33MFTa1.1 TaxID=1279031 RepID=UPI0006904BE4|nr:AraC family transcriptional regulator [Agrobacterium sp. 33MFTa1.1]QBJ16516.1 AraC family transcriptional regulator [Agrobacterium sp. 33MFTa1.1]